MADLVTVEFRGILGYLPVGSRVDVESCEAGVLRLRVIAADPPASTVAAAAGTKKGTADAQVIKDEADATAREGSKP